MVRGGVVVVVVVVALVVRRRLSESRCLILHLIITLSSHEPLGGSKASEIKLVLQREPRMGKTWFPACSILPNEAPVDVAVRELFEKMA
jgi:hypothetical protein